MTQLKRAREYLECGDRGAGKTTERLGIAIQCAMRGGEMFVYMSKENHSRYYFERCLDLVSKNLKIKFRANQSQRKITFENGGCILFKDSRPNDNSLRGLKFSGCVDD